MAASLSGGGFSNFFARPSFQDAAVSAFLSANGNTNAGLFNTTGRGFPDVAAQAENFQVVLGGTVVNVAGTSCASPVGSSCNKASALELADVGVMQTVAGIVSLLNDFLLSQGKSTLGFLNPLLYSTGQAGLNDITSGSNPGCGTAGFTARAGWDVSLSSGWLCMWLNSSMHLACDRSGYPGLRQAAKHCWVKALCQYRP